MVVLMADQMVANLESYSAVLRVVHLAVTRVELMGWKWADDKVAQMVNWKVVRLEDMMVRWKEL